MTNDPSAPDSSVPDYEDLPWAPAAGRNASPIAGVLSQWLPTRGRVLELASGTGQHVARFAAEHPHLQWQPTDPDPDQCVAVDARVQRSGLKNVARALPIPAEAEWPAGPWDAVLAINLVHIAPWPVTEAILGSASRCLSEDGAVLFYGPYHKDGKPTSAGNASFDESLRAQGTGSGIRDLEALVEAAGRWGLTRAEIVEMPANNVFVRLRKSR